MKWPILSFIVAGILSFGLGIGYGWKTNLPPNGDWHNEVFKPAPPPSKTLEAFGVLLAKTPQEIEQVDTATLGWACLGGLGDSQDIDLAAAQERITKLAKIVKDSTQATLEQDRKKDKTVQDTPQVRLAILSYILQQDYKNAHYAEQFDPDAGKFTDWGKIRPEDLLFESAMNNKHDSVFSNAVWFVAVGQDQ